MEVLIDNRQSRHKISSKTIKQTVQVILDALDCPDSEISILIVDDPQIAELNRQYLNREGPTNVIAFAMREGEFPDLSPHLLGDVVISMDTAAREARIAAMSLQRRFNELLVHGILHLMGYDHETTEDDARKMEDKSREILALLDET
ncbi:MAG: rRNA maturation RNase YbeY [Deltaproteobacteria bacterium]|nr:rRNA maturation RNase YbeY [Deltaproteobacteria bacterium]MBW2483201.1 rRNA maturation RNase YbeY [Deltaproteobacteria bacterium]